MLTRWDAMSSGYGMEVLGAETCLITAWSRTILPNKRVPWIEV